MVTGARPFDNYGANVNSQIERKYDSASHYDDDISLPATKAR